MDLETHQLTRNVSQIVEKGLCIGCGACYVACVSNSIKLQLERVFVPKISESCKNCGLCIDVCPVKNWNRLSKDLLGEHIANYIGFATEKDTRYMGSSGGIVTALLCFALDEGLIQGAIVALSPGNNLRSCVTIARTKQEIKSAKGSKYFPVPMVKAIKEILNTEGSFAFVGLPCHLMALKKLELQFPSLKKKIILKLGLFCGRGIDSNGINYILQLYKIPFESVSFVNFRGYGWPGKMSINYSIDGEKKERLIPIQEYSRILLPAYFFMPSSCLFCPDYTAENADISFGDPWKLDFPNDGSSIIISRTINGERFLQTAGKKGYIRYYSISETSVVYSHSEQLVFHKSNIIYRKMLNFPLKFPYETRESFHFCIAHLLLATIILSNNRIYHKLNQVHLFYAIPHTILRFVGMVTSFLKMLNSNKIIESLEFNNPDQIVRLEARN